MNLFVFILDGSQRPRDRDRHSKEQNTIWRNDDTSSRLAELGVAVIYDFIMGLDCL